MNNDAAKSLDVVYGAASADEVATRYDEWADRYDAEMAVLGYRHPTICLALLTRFVPKGVGPILDAGAGTGLLGEWTAITGYDSVEALDISEKMLEIARRKNVYKACHTGVLGESLPFEDDRFGAIVSAGVFTTGHVGPEGLPELVRIMRPGGILILTVKDTLWHGALGKRVQEMADEGIWRILEETPPYISMPNRPDTVPSRALAIKLA